MVDDEKDLCILLDQFWKLETKVEEITDTLIEVRNCLNNGKKGIKEFVQKFDEEADKLQADKLRKERLENFSTSLGVKWSTEEINRLTKITCNLDLIKKIGRSDLIEDHLYHGLLSYFTGNYDKSLEVYDLALNMDSNNPEIWFNKGIVLAELRQIESAIQSFEKALEINPNFYEAQYYKWLYSLKSSKHEEVLENLECLIEDTQNENCWFNAGETLVKINQLENAIRVLDRALELNPDFTKARLLKVISLFDLGEYEKSLDVLNYFSETKVNEPEIFFWKGKVLLKLGQYENSIEALNKVLDTNPEDIKSLYLKIDALSKINVCKKDGMEYKEIVESKEEPPVAKKAETISLENDLFLLQVDKKCQEKPNKWYEEGVKLTENKEYEKAIESFDKALAIDSQCPRVWEIKGLIFLKLGNPEKTIESLNWAIRIWMHYPYKYNIKGSIIFKLNDYENLVGIFKEKLWEKGKEEFGHSARIYSINKILQSELFEPNESSTTEVGSSKTKVVGKKYLKEITQVVEVNDAQLEPISKIDFTETKVINEEINTIPTYEETLDFDNVAEKTFTQIITNLSNFRNDLEEIKNYHEVYCTVYEIINKLNSENDIRNTFKFNYQGNTNHFDIEAANKYICSIIEDFTCLIQDIKQYRDYSPEDMLYSSLKNIYNRRIEDFHKQIENESIQSFETQSPIFEIKDIVERMKVDNPFPESPEDNKDILVGNQARELKFLFESVCRLSLVNPLMTAIIGRSGSGKTHFLKNLEYDSTCNKSKRLVLTYDIKEKIPNRPSDIVDYVYSNEIFRDLVLRHGLKFSDSHKNESKIDEINDSIERISYKINEKFSLCIGVDGIDRYFQNILLENESDIKKIDKEISSFLGTFRMILDNINNVCIIFSLTQSTFTNIWDVVRADQTYRRRIIIPNGIDGKPVELDQLNEKEAYELVMEFMDKWLRENNVNKGVISDYTSTWPFEQEAIKIAWKAAPLVGGLLFVLRESLNEKIEKEIDSFEDIAISELDISKVVFRNRLNTYFSKNPKVWDEIEIITREKELKIRLQELKDDFYESSQKSNLPDAFERYFQQLGFVRDSGKKGLIIHSTKYGNKNISIKFIEETKISKKDSRELGDDLLESKAGAGLFIYIGNEKEDKIELGIDNLAFFKDLKLNTNYVSTIGLRIITEDDVSNIMNLSKIDVSEQKIFVEYLERHLGFRQYLESLEFTEVSPIKL